MWRSLWDRIPFHIRSRPIGTFFTLWLLIVGVFGIFWGIDDLDDPNQIDQVISTWIAAYMIVASILILVSTFLTKSKYKTFHFLGQVYGWFFVASAAAALAVLYAVPTDFIPSDPTEHWFWALTWGLVAVAASFKSIHYLTTTKEHIDE